MNGRMLFPLFSFDFLFDTEIGLFEFIKRFCANPEAFDLDILNQDRDILRKLLDERENQNPLSVISTKENMKDIDPLYQDFYNISSHSNIISEAIISGSPILQGLALLCASIKMNSIKPSVWVKNAYEQKKLSKSLSRNYIDQITVVEKPVLKITDVNRGKYNPIYVRNISDIIDLHDENDNINEPIANTKIYCMDTRYNRYLVEQTKMGKFLSTINSIEYVILKRKEENKNE